MRWILGGVVLFWAGIAHADENWPQFLGPRGDGSTDSTGLPVKWNEKENIRWKTPIPGRGWSSPVIWGSQVWMGSATEDGKKMFAICVHKDSGAVLHTIEVFQNEKLDFCHALNSYASPTSVIEEGRVYVHFGSYGTAAIDTTSGKVLWTRRDLPCNHWRGPASSPILYQNLLIVHYDGYDHQYVVAFNKDSGETVWKKKREVDYGTTDGDVMKAYSTPIVITVNGQPQLISTTSKAALAYEPATGNEIWRLRFSGFSATARPLFGHGLLFINTGFSKAELFAVKPDGHGDITNTHVVWSTKKSIPSMPSSVLVGERLFQVDDTGIASCINAKTGEQVWQHRVEGQFSASALSGDGRIYFFSRDNAATVIAAKDEFELLAENKLDDGCMSSPAVSGKALFVRTKTNLYLIEISE